MKIIEDRINIANIGINRFENKITLKINLFFNLEILCSI